MQPSPDTSCIAIGSLHKEHKFTEKTWRPYSILKGKTAIYLWEVRKQIFKPCPWKLQVLEKILKLFFLGGGGQSTDQLSQYLNNAQTLTFPLHQASYFNLEVWVEFSLLTLPKLNFFFRDDLSNILLHPLKKLQISLVGKLRMNLVLYTSCTGVLKGVLQTETDSEIHILHEILVHSKLFLCMFSVYVRPEILYIFSCFRYISVRSWKRQHRHVIELYIYVHVSWDYFKFFMKLLLSFSEVEWFFVFLWIIYLKKSRMSFYFEFSPCGLV